MSWPSNRCAAAELAEDSPIHQLAGSPTCRSAHSDAASPILAENVIWLQSGNDLPDVHQLSQELAIVMPFTVVLLERNQYD